MSNKKINFYEEKRYETQKGIEEFHDVKYEVIKDFVQYEKAYEDLNKEVYPSIIAEKQRIPYYKKNIKIIGTKKRKKEKFENLCSSYLYSLDKNLSIEDIEIDMYQEIHGNLHKIIYIKDEKFISQFIHKDVIYTDKFELKGIDKKNTKINILKSMKAPFSLDRSSLTSTMIRIDFKRNWKRYIKQISEGVNK